MTSLPRTPIRGEGEPCQPPGLVPRYRQAGRCPAEGQSLRRGGFQTRLGWGILPLGLLHSQGHAGISPETLLHTSILYHTYGQSYRRGNSLKNITLSADENLIEAARRRAVTERTTLNAQFRLWLADYVGREHQAARVAAVLRELRGSISTGGRKFTREEMNER